MRPAYTYSFGEFIDKLSIVSKKELCGLPGARQELDEMMEWLKEDDVDGYFILSIIRIAQSNMDIWHMENEMRNDATNSMPLYEIGKRAIRIRDFNKTRVRYKNELDKVCGINHVEEKIRHLSEEMYTKFYGEDSNE